MRKSRETVAFGSCSPALRGASAFSLVEMLVVIAIIAILLGALLPAFSVVRTNAKRAATQSQFNALNTGITTYRNEQALGGGLPPSASDWPLQSNDAADREKIANPGQDAGRNNGAADVQVSGAHLLVQAMMGADGLGPPGFRDLNRNGRWSDDTHDRDGGAYHIIDSGAKAGQTEVVRYGNAGFVDDKMRERAVSLKDLYEKAVIVTDPSTLNGVGIDEPLFVDAWDHPILYYKATPSAIHMTGSKGRTPQAGVYWQEDNAILTGSDGGAITAKGIDMGAGEDEHGALHWIHDTKSPTPTEKVEDICEEGSDYEHTFARYIIDCTVKARPTPVQKNEYLLISAGPDGIYGSADDVTNFTREKD